MIRRLLTLTLSLAFMFCIQASAQTVDDLIKKNIDAHGGIQKLKAVKSMKATGKIDPFQGNPDPEKVAGDDLKDLEEQSDLDGPLVDYKQKGHSVELIGKEDM